MNVAGGMRAFDVTGPLPRGVTVLEASAGTGKTYTIAALATRYVAEGVATLDQLLLVTFTRMATGELRQRVRDQLVAAENGLTRALAGVRPDPTNRLVALLADVPEDELCARRDRLRVALAGFDAATIDTTHAFCQRVLHGLGVTGDVDPDAAFIEEDRELVEQVVTDFYLRKFARSGNPNFTLDRARRIAREAVKNSDAAIVPPLTGDKDADVRHLFAVRVREEVDRRRRLAGLLSFDDLLTRLRTTLADPHTGPLACQRLRERYTVALVDEFQDTDPIQWEILYRAFVEGDGGTTLVLIGDPKQAIYAFRGADVYAYLRAAEVAGERATLEVNWRSDQALLDAYDAVFDGARLGHHDIVYRDVCAAAGHDARRMGGGGFDAPLRIRMLHRADDLVRTTSHGQVLVDPARELIARDLAADVVRLLSSGARVDGDEVRPGHVAVLVHRNVDALTIRDALHAVRVPAVLAGAGSVFATAAARDWLQLLRALEPPTASGPVRAAALTTFFGWPATRVATAGEAEWEALHGRLHRLAALLRHRGVAALFEAISRRERLAPRLLALPDGERDLTDLRHIGELLHSEVMAQQLGTTALVEWLRTRIDEAALDAGVEDRTRRLESDAEAVQVLTVHRCKGLEFPVVYCPYSWSPGRIEAADPPIFHDPANDDRRTIDVAYSQPAKDRHHDELRGEELRLLYVALTRAKHQAVVWWAASSDSRNSSLGRLLFFREADGTVKSSGTKAPPDKKAVARFDELAARAPGSIRVESVVGGDGSVWTGSSGSAPATLDVSRFGRTLDPRWRRTSYTALTSGAHEVRVSSEAEEPVVSDEVLPVGASASAPVPIEETPAGDEDAAALAALRSVELPLAVMRGGADVGTFVHSVLERCDFAADDLDASLRAAFDEEARFRPVDVGDVAVVVDGLRRVIETPLGPLVGDLRLRDIGRRDRVDELGFELPLVGGDSPTGTLEVAAIGRLLATHLPDGDVLRPYAERLADPALAASLRGYLSGSLDLVLRTPDGRYAVVDYKTNWLAGGDEALSAWHYRPHGLTDAMYRAHYPLQALLYTVALHRYLRWRLPGYAASRHLAGVLYLFVRGMAGADTPRIGDQPCGVFSWAPPEGLIEALSDLFDTGAVAA